jgi:multicomponent Na+:H+ antiporter subunit B
MINIPAVLLTLCLIFLLLTASHDLPLFGSADTPANNELAAYYIDNAVRDTGAVNIVAAVILDYRAFDTLVESTVLFTAAMAVMAVLKKGKKTKHRKTTAKASPPQQFKEP